MDKENLSQMSGENNVRQAPRYNVPLLRLQGNEGKFRKITLGDEKAEEVELDDKIQGVMLKIRRSYVEFGKESRLFTNEHNSWKENVTLFESRKTEKGVKTTLVESGIAGDLKKKYPGLKMQQSIYFLLQPSNEVVKLLVKGKGLSNLFDYWDEFKNKKDEIKNEHVYQFVTELGLVEEQSALGPYYAMTFTRKEKIDDELMEKVAENIKEICDRINEIDSYYAESAPEEVSPKEVKPTRIVEESEIPIVEEDKKEEEEEKEEESILTKKEKDEIDVNDIPF